MDLLNPNYRNLRDIMLINSLQNVITNPIRQDAVLDPIVIPDDMHYLDARILSIPGPSCSKLKMSLMHIVWNYYGVKDSIMLVNDSLKFTSSDTQIC